MNWLSKTGCTLNTFCQFNSRQLGISWEVNKEVWAEFSMRLSCVDNNTISLTAMIQKVSYTDVSFTGLVSCCSNNSCLPCSLHTKRYRPETMIGSVTRIRSDLCLILHGLIEWTLGFVRNRSMYPLLFNNNSLRLIERYRDSSSVDYTESQIAMLPFVIITSFCGQFASLSLANGLNSLTDFYGFGS